MPWNASLRVPIKSAATRRPHHDLRDSSHYSCCWLGLVWLTNAAGKNVRGKAIFFNYFRCVNAFSSFIPDSPRAEERSELRIVVGFVRFQRIDQASKAKCAPSLCPFQGALSEVDSDGRRSIFCHLILINERRWYRWLMHLISGLFFGCIPLSGGG